MCGIAGFIDFNKASSDECLLKMTNSLVHRGPDGFDTKRIQHPTFDVGMGHRRLSIIDLSEHGTQPMKWQSLWICYNGEIYNYKELKAELKTLGHTFAGDSDTEMILHAYKAWGKACVTKFIGMFAIFIFDEENQEVFCVRDRAGVKPFFYYFKDGLFLFASELKAFHQHPKFNKEIDPNAVAAYMQYGNVPTPHCIFTDCKKLKPGHHLTINLLQSSSNLDDIKQIQYWNVYDFYNQSKLTIPYEVAQKETEKIIESAVNYRMVSDVPVGVFLSGGYDSSCVTALLQKDRTEKLKTFTIGVPDIGLNEAPYAKDIAQHLGTDHTEIECTEKEALEMIHDLPHYFDEPLADSSAIPTSLVSKMARKDVTVALSADGGDEVFAGYNRYDYMMRYGKKLNKIPGFARKSMVGIMNQVSSERIPILKNKYNFHNRYEKMKGVLRNPSDREIMLSLSQQFTDNQMKSLMSIPFVPLRTMYLSEELQEVYHSPLSYMTAIDYQTYMLDDILQKVDRSTMIHSLEGREPLLDHRIIEYAAQLPDEFKYKDGIKKRILRDITHQYIPQSLMDRPKMGFAIPLASWLTNDLRELVEMHLSQSIIEKQGILNWNYVHDIKSKFYQGKKEYDTKLWYILMFQMWYEKWGN